MNKVVVLGRGGAGKSNLAARLGAATALPVVELDKHFWSADLVPLSADQWTQIQRELVSESAWILDGDLGPYDALDVRLQAADTIIVLDFPLWRCAWRAVRRSRENLAFWRWVIGYRRRSLPLIMAAIANHECRADTYILRSPDDAENLLARTKYGHVQTPRRKPSGRARGPRPLVRRALAGVTPRCCHRGSPTIVGFAVGMPTHGVDLNELLGHLVAGQAHSAQRLQVCRLEVVGRLHECNDFLPPDVAVPTDNQGVEHPW